MKAGRKPDINKYFNLIDQFNDERLFKLFSKKSEQIKSEGYNRKIRDRLANIIATQVWAEQNRDKVNELSRKSYQKHKEKYRETRKIKNKIWWANLSKEEKKRRNELKIKQYHEDKAYREKMLKDAKRRRENRSEEKKKADYLKIKKYAKNYAKNQQTKLDETGDYKVFLQWKRRRVQASARGRGIEFNLSKEYLYNLYNKQKGLCYYTGEKMKLKIYSGVTPNRENIEIFKNYLTIDRLNSSIGYVEKNVVLCTLKVNTAKGSLSYDEFVKIANFVKTRDFNIK